MKIDKEEISIDNLIENKDHYLQMHKIYLSKAEHYKKLHFKAEQAEVIKKIGAK